MTDTDITPEVEPTAEPEVDEVEPTAEPEVARYDKLSDDELIARRSADISTDAATNGEHVKVFVLPPGPKPTEANGHDHRANFAATRQYAISQGLRPTGDVRHVSTKPCGPGGKSWAITYAVPVTPAEKVVDWAEVADVKVVTENETDEAGHVPGIKATPTETAAKVEKTKAKAADKSKATKPTV